ncbi:hypothetical protein [Halorubrum ezzemoulense]|uniref:hypothetical protein n=1 Tax=Halorubrum ezzemoulense TaxID=337243 RepID=UPI0023312FD3|nr:hypothetical protein [Halorubrum ezzemoulense]MDB9252875.1 hypothetical protein [Halorubrum ezzemoulense]MDB9256741.1 hypothetical protein [Halorubrum ezzemoulense]MDB9277049.1 hypothetical protein [Halorubrum ezzemoulense]
MDGSSYVESTGAISFSAGSEKYPSKRRFLGELSILFAVPSVLLVVFTLPSTIRQAYAFSYTEPSLVTAFTAHYVHLTPSHLIGNLIGYALLVAVAYGLSLVAGYRRLFFTSLITFLLGFPFVLSGLNLAIPRNAIGFGFSGINMALFGYVTVMLVTIVDNRFDSDGKHSPPALFFASVAYIAIVVLPVSAISGGIILGGLAIGIAYGCVGARHATRSVQDTITRIFTTRGEAELIAVGTVVVVAYPVVGFPTPTPGGPRINIYIHFVAYALAFIAVFVSLLLSRSARF